MSMFPLTMPVMRLRAGEGGTDAHGNPIPGVPVENELLVFSWWIGSSGEPFTEGHVQRVDSDAGMIANAGDFEPSDRVQLPGQGVFDVDGYPENYDHNPWWSPGVVMVNLTRVEG